MYLHLGDDAMIAQKDVIGIFDMDAVTVTEDGKNFLRRAEKNRTLINISENLPKSFIVCAGETKKSKVYISQISSATLLRRWGKVQLEP